MHATNSSASTPKLKLEEVLPSGLDYTTANVGNKEALDSDVDPLTGTTAPIPLAPGESNHKVDIGLVIAPETQDPNTGIIE